MSLLTMLLESSANALVWALAGALLALIAWSVGRRRNERALRELNATLEQRVAERTAALESALTQSRRLTDILEATSDLVGMADMQGRLLYVNRNGLALTGHDPTGAIGRLSFADFYTPAALDEIMREMLPAAVQQGSVLYETRLLHADGHEIPVSIVGIVHFGPDGAPERLSAVARDISEQKRTQAELEAARDAAERALSERTRLAAIIEATSDYVGIADLQGNSLYVNRAGRALIGLSDEEYAQTRNVIDCYPARVRPLAGEMVAAALRGEVWSGEIALLHKAGREIPVSEVTFALPDDAGGAAYLATIIRDISDQKLAQAELEAAREAAEAASRAKSTFLANMSHEIRTPMNAVIGMTGLLLNTALDPRQRDFVETIRSAGDALLAVINDILDFSKIEAGKLDLEQQPFDLRACVESAIDLLAPRAEEKGLNLAFRVADEVPAGVVGDMARLRQVLVNLLANAIKFTERGEVVLTVSHEGVRESQALAHTLTFSVRDSGIGIRAEQLPHLFRSFSQLDPSTTRVYGGTGLGLAISRRLAELMGGAMWAESEGPGRGATFSFSIEARPAPLPSRPYLRQRRPELAGRRVLIVDDTPTNRRILQLQLQTWGMHVVEAATPRAALGLAASLPFDLAILDMDLPEMDGVALGEALRAALGDAAPSMLMLTSLGQVGSEPCMEIFAACLSKPVKPSQLYDALVGIFAEREPGPAAAPPALDSPQPLADGLPLRILVAEDVAVNQKFALLALEDLGYRADVVANGLEALTAVARQPYDVVLMDVQMPELDGLEATRRIHQLWGAQRDLPTPTRPYIVAMTANSLRGDRELCLEAGMDDYISKPVYLGELRATLERAGAARSASAQPPFTGTILQKLLARPRGQELLALYAAESAELVARLREAAAAGDSLGLRAAAHSLKGSSRYVGAEAIAALCVELERRAAEPAGAPALVAALGEAHARALAAIAELSGQEVAR